MGRSKGKLIWEDDFDGDLDLDKWDVKNAGRGFGKDQLQFYTPKNVWTENGNLIIESRKESCGDKEYTSARLHSKDVFHYGYIEMKAILPKGIGTWPAFWLKPSTDKCKCPDDGEIDIMEHVGFKPGVIHTTIHCANHNSYNKTHICQKVKLDDAFDNYHIYAVDWTPNKIKGYVDDKKYFEYKKDCDSYENWPFDNEFYMVVNTAIGGTWGGKKGVDDSVFPTRFTIDYIRVYEPQNDDDECSCSDKDSD